MESVDVDPPLGSQAKLAAGQKPLIDQNEESPVAEILSQKIRDRNDMNSARIH